MQRVERNNQEKCCLSSASEHGGGERDDMGSESMADIKSAIVPEGFYI